MKPDLRPDPPDTCPHPVSQPPALSVDEARERILSRIAVLDGTETLPLSTARGRFLAADLVSPIDVPGHDNSAMDGYALRHADLAADTATHLPIAGTALAGHPFQGSLPAGQCVRIMTGAVMPTGADTVVMQEEVEATAGATLIPAGVKAGQNRRRAGEDTAAGSVALAGGQALTPAALGLVASVGIHRVSVVRRPRVAVLSGGDELAQPGQPLKPGQVHDSNRVSLMALLTGLGCEVLDLGIVADDPEALESALSCGAAMADIVLSSGGVSVGEADFIHGLLSKLGEVDFWKVNMKPGRPLAFGRIGKAAFFGLPGNPVAASVAFVQFVRPALLKMMGASPLPALPEFDVTCASALKKAPGRREYQRGILSLLDGRWQVTSTGPQGSGMLRSLVRANCFIVLDEARGNVAPGETVRVQVFEGLM